MMDKIHILLPLLLYSSNRLYLQLKFIFVNDVSDTKCLTKKLICTDRQA